jgi:uncharacterized protein DUF4157
MRNATRAPLQPSAARPVSQRNDPFEREADRAADAVVRGGSVAAWSFSRVAPTAQRQGDDKPKTEEENYKEAAEKAGKAALATPQGQALKKRVLADPLVKRLTSPAVLATALGGGVVGLAAAGKELPIQPPELDLDFITPGLSGSVTWKGPVARPTEVGLTLTFRERAPKRRRVPTGPERPPATGGPIRSEAEEQRLSQEAIDYVVAQQTGRFAMTIPLTPPAPEQKEGEQAPAQPAPASATAQAPAEAHVDDALASPGRALDPRTRRAMEARFGRDFSGVRIHDDARAAQTAESIDAAAFTVGDDIAFAPGRFDPAGADGRRLLAHELTHVLQQGAGESVVQRLGAGEFLSRVFGEGTFDDKELQAYLEARDSGEIEDDFDSDNKARAIVRAWRNGGSPWILTARRKSVLIREMLSGAVFDDDEQMILELLVRSFNAELRYIFTTGGVSPNDVDKAIDGSEHDRLVAFFEQRFEGGREAVLKGQLKPQGDAVPLGEDIEQVDADLGFALDLPAADRNWDVPCLLGIFCTIAPDVIDGLRSVKVVRFTEIDVDRWTYADGTWSKETAHPSGYEHNEGAERTVGLKRRRECADVAKTLKHEVVHTGQHQTTIYEREVEAYTEAEAFAITYGLPETRGLRRETKAGGQEPDPAGVEAYVRKRYGGPEEGEPEDVLIDHKDDGTAVVRKPDGKTYERPPKEGDVYLDETPKLAGEEEIPAKSWACPPRSQG